MQRENWKKVKELLDGVMQIEPSRRMAFLEETNVADEIAAEVRSLLSFDEASADLMQLSAVEFSSEFMNGREAGDSLSGQQIGAYRVVSEIGHGGMGAVYLAERVDGKFTQRVALKLLKREMNTSALRKRFEQEREILARLEHPNIARLLDAGTTDDKIPYFAMEYIEGRPIDEYCSKQRLDLGERLVLFRQICSTVDFAHRNLVVHRDLKPSNILVTDDGTPKLLDFGISKFLTNDHENEPAATVTRLGAMTPSYASPEQLRSESVTTSTDIYSLGVILYELLSGHRPFETKESNLQEIYKAVLDTDPPLPSVMAETQPLTTDISDVETELATSGETPNQTRAYDLRRTAPQMFHIKPQYLRGDLDNIILKALKKEPQRRYLSAENFGEDIKRHQDGLPVTARPDTFRYRAEKFVRRNSYYVLAGSLIFIALLAGVIATVWQARVAQAERERAEKRFGDVRKLANSYLFDVYPEIENIEGSLKAREKILTNALQYLDSLSGEATGDLELQAELATAYEKVGDVQGALNNSSLGNIQAGLDSYTKARTLREAVFNADPSNLDAKEKLANNYYVTARTLWNNSQTNDAEAMFEKGLKLRRELAASLPDSVETHNRLAVLLVDYGAIPVFNFQNEKAIALFDEALKINERLRQKDPNDADLRKTWTRTLRIFGKAKGATGDYEGGRAALQTAIEVSRELAGQFPKDFRVQRTVWLSQTMLCELYIDKEDPAVVVEACKNNIAFPKAALEKEPENGVVAYDLAISHFNLARAYRIDGDPAKAIEECENAIRTMSALIRKEPDNGDYKRNIAVYESEMARVQIAMGQFDRALDTLGNVITTMTKVAADDPGTTTNQYDLAVAYRLSAQTHSKKGDNQKAAAEMQNALDIVRKLKELNSLKRSDENLAAELEAELAAYRN